MKLIEAIGDLHSFDAESTIYAAHPWSAESEVVIAHEPDDGGLPSAARNLGLRYFLEVFLARDFLDDWKGTLAQPPSPQEMCSRLIRYVMTDA